MPTKPEIKSLSAQELSSLFESLPCFEGKDYGHIASPDCDKGRERLEIGILTPDFKPSYRLDQEIALAPTCFAYCKVFANAYRKIKP